MGLVFLAKPFILRWRIHGDYERYVWIISGPRPHDKFGGGPFQLVMYSTLFLTGLSYTVVALAVRAALRRISQALRIVGTTGDILGVDEQV